MRREVRRFQAHATSHNCSFCSYFEIQAANFAVGSSGCAVLCLDSQAGSQRLVYTLVYISQVPSGPPYGEPYGELSVSDVCRVTVCDLRLTWRELFTVSLGQCTVTALTVSGDGYIHTAPQRPLTTVQ